MVGGRAFGEQTFFLHISNFCSRQFVFGFGGRGNVLLLASYVLISDGHEYQTGEVNNWSQLVSAETLSITGGSSDSHDSQADQDPQELLASLTAPPFDMSEEPHEDDALTYAMFPDGRVPQEAIDAMKAKKGMWQGIDVDKE